MKAGCTCRFVVRQKLLPAGFVDPYSLEIDMPKLHFIIGQLERLCDAKFSVGDIQHLNHQLSSALLQARRWYSYVAVIGNQQSYEYKSNLDGPKSKHIGEKSSSNGGSAT